MLSPVDLTTVWDILTLHFWGFIESLILRSQSSFWKHSWEAANDGSNTWIPVTHLGDPIRIPDSWLQPASALASADIWGVNQWCKSSLSPSLYHTASKIHKSLEKNKYRIEWKEGRREWREGNCPKLRWKAWARNVMCLGIKNKQGNFRKH